MLTGKIPNSVLDENVDVHLVRSYFTNDAWLIVKDVLKRKTKSTSWICHSCNRDLYIHRLQLFVNLVYNGTTFSVLESWHSPERRTGFVVHVLSSYSVDSL